MRILKKYYKIGYMIFLSGGLREVNLGPQEMAGWLSIYCVNMRKRL